MVLGFKMSINGKATRFKEQILAGTKKHTIRSGTRWEEGIKIQMFSGVRTKLQKQFNADRPELAVCTGVQRIFIKWKNTEDDGALPLWGRWVRLWISGSLLAPADIEILAQNDGFLNLEAFFEWFNDDFEGQIVHWANFKYETKSATT